MCDGIMPIYESELPEYRYNLYEKMVNEYKLKKVKQNIKLYLTDVILYIQQ